MSKKILSVVSLSLVIILLVTLVAFVGCTKATPTPAPTVAPTTAPTKTATPTATVAPPTATATPTPAAVIDPAKVLPKMMYWSGYDVGSGGYIQAAALADAIMKKYGNKIRVIPSGTSVGRMAPLKTGMATYGRFGDEAYWAANAGLEFSTYDWGPIPVRMVINYRTSGMVATAADANIKTPYDAKGKRMAYVPGSPTLNQKVEAFLAFANLTWNDVIKVEFPSYSAALKGIVEGKVDGEATIPEAATMFELASSPRGIRWPDLDPNDKEGWARIQKVLFWLEPVTETEGAGISKDKPVRIWCYPYPLCTLASVDETEVYALTKALDETFDMYKDAAPGNWRWKLDIAGPPSYIPFHPGTIKYFKEKGLWKPEHDAWNAKYEAALAKIEKAWQTVVDEATGKSIKEADFPAYWAKRRVELGAPLFGMP